MGTTATFVIDFGSIEDAFLTVELDSVKNNDATSFIAGDEVFFKIYSDCNYTIEVSSGTVKNGNVNVSESVTKDLVSFIKGASVSTQKKIVSSVNAIWFGNNLGNIIVSSTNQVQASMANEDTLGIASLSYLSEYNEHSIVPPSGMSATYYILVYIKAIS